MIMDTEIMILENRGCSFDGHECCIDVTLAYDVNSIFDPYHLHVELFGDFTRDEWYESKEKVIEELKDLDERFDSDIIDAYDTLKAIEAFVEPEEEIEG